MLTTVNKRVWNRVGYTCRCLGTLTISITYNCQIYQACFEAAIFCVCILLFNYLVQILFHVDKITVFQKCS